MSKKSDEYSEAEAQRRFEQALKGAAKAACAEAQAASQSQGRKIRRQVIRRTRRTEARRGLELTYAALIDAQIRSDAMLPVAQQKRELYEGRVVVGNVRHFCNAGEASSYLALTGNSASLRVVDDSSARLDRAPDTATNGRAVL